jgi:TetR/AcrR family transcriptional repressor of nem operon
VSKAQKNLLKLIILAIMARPKEFDREEVLEKAMETFWLYGYEATSMQTLVNNMGINRGSLYDTFGDKRSLFQAAIAHYEEKFVHSAIARLQEPNASKQAIIDFFKDLVAKAIADPDCRGCFLINTAVELCPHDPETRDRIRANFQKIENAFYNALNRAKSQGEINQQQNIRALARFLTCSLQGLKVTSKVLPDRETLKDIVQTIVRLLD